MFVGFFVYVARDFSKASASIFFLIFLVFMAWVWRDGIFLAVLIIFAFCLGCLLV